MPDHRCERLLERYGLTMTSDQIDRLEPLCTPSNRLRRMDHGDVHVIRHEDNTLIAVCRFIPQKNRRVLVTFMVADYFTAGRRARDVAAATGKAGKSGGWLREGKLRRRRERRAEP